MILLLIKHQLLTGHTDSHYAGGIHLFSCMAAALAASGAFTAVHTLSTVPTKAMLLHHAVTHGVLPKLQSTTSGCGDAESVSWQQAAGLHHTVIVGNGGTSAGAAAALLAAAAADAVRRLSASGQAGCVLLDIDTLQHAQVPATALPTDPTRPVSSRHPPQQYPCSSSSSNHHVEQQQQQQQPSQATVPFMLALAQVLQQQSSSSCTQTAPAINTGHHHPQQLRARVSPWPLLALVQNIHHMPFGPCGTGPRSEAVLQGWRPVQGVLCVSQFVHSYCMQHALPLLPQLQPQQQHLHVFHPAAFKVWGEGPFEDLGSRAAAQIWGHQPGAQQQQPQQHQHGVCDDRNTTDIQQPQMQQHGWHQVPLVGVLKLTHEKGSDLLLALAGCLPQLQFKAVCADPWVRQEVASRQQAGRLSNLQLVPPTDDVAAVLQGVCLLLVLSVLQEAFGMVVLDGMLHGLPVLVADAGALPEAAAGAAAAALPVALVEFPSEPSVKQPTACTHASTAAMAEVADGSSGPQAAAGASYAGGDSSTAEAAGDCACVGCWVEQAVSWESRQYLAQQQEVVDSWAAAIRQVLSSRDGYVRLSDCARAAAVQVLQEGPDQLAGVVRWLQEQVQQDRTGCGVTEHSCFSYPSRTACWVQQYELVADWMKQQLRGNAPYTQQA